MNDQFVLVDLNGELGPLAGLPADIRVMILDPKNPFQQYIRGVPMPPTSHETTVGEYEGTKRYLHSIDAEPEDE